MLGVLDIALNTPQANAVPILALPLPAGPRLPGMHQLPPHLPKVHHLQSDAIRVGKERRVLVWPVLGVVARLAGLYSCLLELPRGTFHRSFVHHPKAEVMQPWRVGVVVGGVPPRESQRVREVAAV